MKYIIGMLFVFGALLVLVNGCAPSNPVRSFSRLRLEFGIVSGFSKDFRGAKPPLDSPLFVCPQSDDLFGRYDDLAKGLFVALRTALLPEGRRDPVLAPNTCENRVPTLVHTALFLS
jgi:hypothetical protein